MDINDPRRQNYIGRRLKVIDANNKALIGIEGLIVDETMKSLKIMTHKGEIKTILKKGSRLLIGPWHINGEEIMKRPDQRIKMRIKEALKIRQQPLMV